MKNNRKKKFVLQSLLGFPVGVTIGHFITILLSLVWADGYYSPCMPQLETAAGSQINAVLLQTLLCGLMGVGFAASSFIWKIERWSLALQTGIYFLIVSSIMLPIAYFLYWMEHSPAGLFKYWGVFTLIFLIVWVIECIVAKRNVTKMNRSLHRAQDGEDK